jgi:hypothetical protein
MSTTTRARTARKNHRCSECLLAVILPGHRYLLHTTFPNDVIQAVTVSKECLSCACEQGEDYRLDACMGFCCGDVPCARPFRHDGDHSCRRCAEPLIPPMRLDEMEAICVASRTAASSSAVAADPTTPEASC